MKARLVITKRLCKTEEAVKDIIRLATLYSSVDYTVYVDVAVVSMNLGTRHNRQAELEGRHSQAELGNER